MRPFMLLLSSLVFATVVGCKTGWADPSREYAEPFPDDGTRHAVVIEPPLTLGVADTNLRDPAGRPVGVACQTCHGPTPDASMAKQHDEKLHKKIDLQHGDLTCHFCHDSEDRTKLHLADGTLLEMGSAMTLCAQCHGVQYRDYRNGSHGGMAGHWDLNRGPRTRNHCVDCHAPHEPAYKQVLPVHPPRDRYLDANGAH